MKVISFGKLSIYMIYPLLYILTSPLFDLAKEALNSPLSSDFYFITSIGLMFLAEIIAGCIYFIQKCKMKKEPQIDKPHFREKTRLEKRFLFTTKKYTLPMILVVFGIATLDLVSTILSEWTSSYWYNSTVGITNILMVLNFFIYLGLSIRFLHQEVFKHHYVSFGINVLSFIIILIPYFISSLNIIQMISKFLIGFTFPAIYVFEKWIMHYKRFNPFFLLLAMGLFGFFLFLLIYAGEYLFCPRTVVQWYCADLIFFNGLTIWDFWFFLLELFRCVIVNILIMLIIKYYTPLHLFVSSFFISFMSWVIYLIKGTKIFDAYTLVGYSLLLIGSCIFNETVILHFWGLDYNTREMISLRSQNDFLITEMRTTSIKGEERSQEISQNNDNGGFYNPLWNYLV